MPGPPGNGESWFELEVTSDPVYVSWFELEVTSDAVDDTPSLRVRLPYHIIGTVGLERRLPYSVTQTVGLQRALAYEVLETEPEPEQEPLFPGGGQTGTFIGGPLVGKPVEFRQDVLLVFRVPLELRVPASLHLVKRFSTTKSAEISSSRRVSFSIQAQRTTAQRWSRLRREDDELLALLSD